LQFGSGQEGAGRAALSIAGVAVSGFVDVGLASALSDVQILALPRHATLYNAVELPGVDVHRRLI